MLRKTILWTVFALVATTQLGAQSTTQTIRSYSANSGLYSNRIINFSPPNAFTEICFVGGAVQSDIHVVGEPTLGGNCIPGDPGWVIEANERGAATWDLARAACLVDGMRLPEPFEWRYSCGNAAGFGLAGMTNASNEWASNTTSHQSEVATGYNYVAASVLGGDGCTFGDFGSIGNTVQVQDFFRYRCVR